MKDKRIESVKTGEEIFGFEIVRCEELSSRKAVIYTMKHRKTGTELIYSKRDSENKTFSVCFKTLPEDSTGVFHILEHSVLNGSEKYPVKEPFVSMLRSSMQTYLNAMTFPDKTVYPVSSRNERDFFNLMKVYLDAVFAPKILKGPEIFMQEGWHYEFLEGKTTPHYNGVVFSEMKGGLADVDSIIEMETAELLFPDNSYGYNYGGAPESITDLTYEKFIETYKRFYHPSNARIFLDGDMDVFAVLEYIDGEYLSKYAYRESDFDFVKQVPKAREKETFYSTAEENDFSHLVMAKILCDYDDREKLIATRALADYLAGSNEAPLTRAVLESGLAQDVVVSLTDGVYQPYVSVIVRNTREERFPDLKKLVSDTVKKILAEGIDKKAILATLDRLAFTDREIHEPYGLVLNLKMLDGWLYGGNPLSCLDNDEVFRRIKELLSGDYFEKLLEEILSEEGMSYLYVLPSNTKGQEDALREREKLEKTFGELSPGEKDFLCREYRKFTEWQQIPDSEDLLQTLPHLNVKDIPREVKKNETELYTVKDRQVLKTVTDTGGIVYFNLYFDVSDLSCEQLRKLSVVSLALGELGTEKYDGRELQKRIKTVLGGFSSKIEILSKRGNIEEYRAYLAISASMLKEKSRDALELILEILKGTKICSADKIKELLLQSEYILKQALISDGEMFAITRALSRFSAESGVREKLEGESFVRWFGEFTKSFSDNPDSSVAELDALYKETLSLERAFVGFGGELSIGEVEEFLNSLRRSGGAKEPEKQIFEKESRKIEIPSGVGFTSIGHNLYALGCELHGSHHVLATMMTFGYLWNAIRVQGGAYGTGLSVRANGDMFCYSYRDPNPANSRNVYSHLSESLRSLVMSGEAVDDAVIATVNKTDPLLSPAGVVLLECIRHLKGTTVASVNKLRAEILDTTLSDLERAVSLLESFENRGCFVAVGDADFVKVVKDE